MDKKVSAEVKYQIFISSTFEDLQVERRILMEQILNLGHIPVGMELFQAANQEQWTYIEQRIKNCDYYLLIVAERYGSLGEDGKSYTQKEYEYAVANNIPVVSFLLSSEKRKTRRADFVQHDRREEIEAFRTLCSKSKMVKFWDDPSDLALKATNALLGLIRDEPQQGWVKADKSIEGALKELAKLAEEKRALQDKLNMVSSSKDITIPSNVKYHMDKLFTLNVVDFIDIDDSIDKFVPTDLLNLLIKISRDLSYSIKINQLVNLIYRKCECVGGAQYSAPFAHKILREYSAFNIIEVYTISEAGSTVRMVKMTAYGKELLMHAEQNQELQWEIEESAVKGPLDGS